MNWLTTVEEAVKSYKINKKYCAVTTNHKHKWKDHVDSWTDVTGDGHLVIICEACGFVRHLEDT